MCIVAPGWCAGTGDEALELIAVQEARIPALKAQLEEVRASETPVHYPQADLLIAERFCTYCRDDVANGRPERAIEVAREVCLLLDRASAEMRDGVAVPVLKRDAPIEIRDGSFWAECDVEGKSELRPVFFTGYGHWTPAVDDLPFWGQIGINILQIEIGPIETVFEEGNLEDGLRSRILPALDRARDNGVRLNLLTSPHYFPDWAYAKWPELKVQSGDPGTQPFLKNSVEAPQTRDIYERHLGTVIPIIKDHPALHSICLSNEPVYHEGWKDPARLGLWHDYLRRIHGDIANLNTVWGTDYASFEDIPEIAPSFKEPAARMYDAVRFNQGRFSGWHKWMVDLIHAISPGLPCHAKVMNLMDDRDTVFWGTDPLEFAELSQINGNDCYCVPFEGRAPYATEFLSQNKYYDLQRSMKRVPIFNSENHIILDRTQFFVPAEHVYTAIWQGAVHGQGASATWIWQRTYDPKSDAEGLILHRAACTAAMSRCALDLMRLSREMAAIQNAAPEVAILFSHAATLQDKRYFTTRARLYEALNFCGIPIAFVTDEQVAAGKLKDYKVLIVPQAQAATRASIEAIRAYAQEGGRVLVYGEDNLTRDEYGRDVAPPKRMRKIQDAKGVDLRDALMRLLAKDGVTSPVDLQTAAEEVPYGVEWRSAELDGHTLVNLVNFTRKPISVRLPSGTWEDLITLQPLPIEITLQPNVPLLAKGLNRQAAKVSGQTPHLELLPGAVPAPPSYGKLSRGSLKVRLFPTQTKPCLQHYVSLSAGASSSNYISTVERLGLSGSWALMGLLPDDGLEQYIATGDPIACYFTITAIQNHQVECNAPLRGAMDYVEKNHKGFYTFGVCEWENTFYRHWEKETDTTAIYGATPSELSKMDRKGNYEVLERTVRRWKASARDRMMMANGYGMLAHLAEVGLDAIGIETSETIPATQVKRAFARGAARQFGIPWFEEVSVWFGASVSGGMPTSSIVYWPNTPVGGDAGHSVSHLMRHWFTSWFSGASHVMLEASPQVLFEVPWSSEFPEDAKLSRYGIEARRLAGLMKRLDIGVPYTPFAVLINKHHGRWSVWGKPWGRLEQTPGDQMTERFFDQVFPGQSQGPGNEERYLCSSPYGDTFDVLVNDAARDAWRAYPVILAVGDVPWTAEDIAFLKGYVQDGGILALNEINLEGWDRAWLGLASEGFAASGEAQTVLSGNDGQPRLIRRTIGKGCVLVSSSNPEPNLNQFMAFPDELIRSLASQYIPFQVEGDVQTLINRTKDGWALMVVNNKGITKELHVDQAPTMTSSATQHVSISYQGKLTQMSEVIYGCTLQIETNDTGTVQHIRFDLPPGELRLITIQE